MKVTLEFGADGFAVYYASARQFTAGGVNAEVRVVFFFVCQSYSSNDLLRHDEVKISDLVVVEVDEMVVDVVIRVRLLAIEAL